LVLSPQGNKVKFTHTWPIDPKLETGDVLRWSSQDVCYLVTSARKAGDARYEIEAVAIDCDKTYQARVIDMD
jgi:hypothetical protein